MRLTPLIPVVLVLAACGSDPAADAPTTVEANAANAAPSATTVPVADGGGQMATLPDYVPLIPDGKLMMAEDRGGTLTAAIQAPGTVKDAAAFYEQTLKNNDMNPSKQTAPGDGVMLRSNAKGRDLTISVGPGPGGEAMVGVTDKPGG